MKSLPNELFLEENHLDPLWLMINTCEHIVGKTDNLMMPYLVSPTQL